MKEMCPTQFGTFFPGSSYKRVREFQIKLDFRSVCFCGQGENRSARIKTSRSKGEN